MTGVQLIGSKAVLHRYEKLGAEAWALYQGKQFIVGGTGADALRDWISDFEAAGSTATYTLRVYDSDEVPTSSTGTVDYVAAVNFKAVDVYEGYGIAGHNAKLMERIKGLEDKLNKEDETEESGFDLNEIITGWLTEPQKLGMVIGAVRQLFGVSTAGTNALQTVSGIEPVKQNVMSTEDSLKRIADAIDILAIHDADLVVHLEKLAKLAQTDALMFKAIISKLDAL